MMMPPVGRLPGGISSEAVAAKSAPAVADGAFYSTAFETTLKSTSYPGMSRAAHFQEANGALLRAMEGSPEIAAECRALESTWSGRQRAWLLVSPRLDGRGITLQSLE